MTKLVQEAIEGLRELPAERQEAIVRVILNYASQAADDVDDG